MDSVFIILTFNIIIIFHQENNCECDTQNHYFAVQCLFSVGTIIMIALLNHANALPNRHQQQRKQNTWGNADLSRYMTKLHHYSRYLDIPFCCANNQLCISHSFQRISFFKSLGTTHQMIGESEPWNGIWWPLPLALVLYSPNLAQNICKPGKSRCPFLL